MAISHPLSWGGQEAGSMATLVLTYFLMVALIAIPFASYLLRWSRKGEGKTGLPPGPRGLPLLGYLPFLKPDLHRCFADLARTYGPVVRLRLGSRTCVVLTSPAAAREAHKDHDAMFANRDAPAVTIASVFERHDMVWSPYGPHWRMLRKVTMRELLNPVALDGLSMVRRREVGRMVEEVRGRAGEPVNLRELVSATAMNATTMMLWGDTVMGEGEALGREFLEVLEALLLLQGEHNVSDFFPALAWFDLQGLGRRMRRLSSWLNRIFDTIIEQRLTTGPKSGGEGNAAAAAKKGRDFLQVMVELLRKGDQETPLTMMHVKALILDMVAGGIETTTTTVEWAMAELLCDPQKMTKAKEEIAGVVGEDGIVEESHLPKLQYLDAVVKEVLRLHPVLPLLVPRRPSSSCTIAGYRIPEGSRVFINAWAIHRDPQFWKDACMFVPERFLGAADHKLDYSGNSFCYLPFGAGRRICPGVPFGERMVMFMLASLLHGFDWTMPDGVKLDLSEKFGLVMKKEEALVAVPRLQ